MLFPTGDRQGANISYQQPVTLAAMEGLFHTQTGAPIALAEKALQVVQGLDPPGVGARSLAECLALQAKAADRYDPALAHHCYGLVLELFHRRLALDAGD